MTFLNQSVITSLGSYIRETVFSVQSAVRSARWTFPYIFGIGEERKEVTELYPDPISSRTPEELPPRTRGILNNDVNKCTGCGDCLKVCPARCIEIKTEDGPDMNKIWISTFDIDLSKCVFCGLCTRVCAPRSLTHTRQFEGAVFQKEDLVLSFGRGLIAPELREKWNRIRKQKGEG